MEFSGESITTAFFFSSGYVCAHTSPSSWVIKHLLRMVDLLRDLSDLITAVDVFTFLKIFSFCSAQVFHLRSILDSKNTHHGPCSTHSAWPKIIIPTSEGRICSKCYCSHHHQLPLLNDIPSLRKTQNKTINNETNQQNPSSKSR